jgi:serine/threonine protein kinase
MRKIRTETDARSLKSFRGNIVELEGIFIRCHTLYLLLPWADRGSLHDLLCEGPTPDWSPRVFKTQVSGLVGALSLLHTINCRHGDLKPDNILVFTDIGGEMKFKIADFGLTMVHEHATSAREESTKSMTGAQRYEPPEVSRDHGGRNKAWSRKYDVWSLGCIFLEFIIWERYGAESLKEFNEELGPRRVEKFWKRDSDGRFQVHPVVVDRIKKMKEDLSCNTDSNQDQANLMELLTKVETMMLVIETNSEEGSTEKCRATAIDIFSLRPIAKKAPQRSVVQLLLIYSWRWQVIEHRLGFCGGRQNNTLPVNDIRFYECGVFYFC